MASPQLHRNIFKAIFEDAPVGLVVLGKTGTLLYANRAFTAMIGETPEDVRDSALSSYLHAEDRPTLDRLVERLSGAKADSMQVELRYGKNGSAGWLRMNASCVTYPWQSGRFIVGFLSDISEQKADEDRLKTEKEDAEKATRIKSDFLANMSHEIRTPIHTIIGMTELLRETKLDAEQAEYATQVEFSADVLLSLINDVLDFSKIEAGKLSLETIELDIYRTAEDAVDLVSLEAHKKGLEVLVDIRSDVPRFMVGDPVRVRQVIVNLFSNAMKFTEKGEIAITVQGEEDAGGERWIRVSVRDTGIGIPREKMNKLFRGFSQVDSSTTRKYGGSGLGLSICKNLVDLMGGTIGVESEVGAGSEFLFMIPYNPPSQHVHTPLLPAPLPNVERALIVDDNDSVRRILRSYLSEWGVPCDECSGGEAGVEMVRRAASAGAPYGVCIVDLLMPRMDGWHFASEIRSDDGLSDTKLFLLSPTGKSGDEAKMKLLNWFAGYITKPVKRDDFYGVLLRSLSEVEELEPIDESEPEAVEQESLRVGALSGSILVAEDHEVNQSLFRVILENLGFRVLLASNGVEAVDRTSDEVKLIFMDVQMPEMNGYEATRELRRRGFDIPIIAVTASAVKGEREQAFGAGMTDFLTKPFKKQDVVRQIRSWLLEPFDEATAPEPADVRPAVAGDDESTAELGDDAHEIFDFDQAVDTFLGNRDTVVDLVVKITDRINGQLSAIRTAYTDRDFVRLREEAHSIKGSARNLSICRTGDAAEVLERAALEEDAASALSAMGNLEAAFAEFAEYSRRMHVL